MRDILLIVVSAFYVTGGFTKPDWLGENADGFCTTLRYDCSYCQPEQIHIAFGEKVNDMVIMWSTQDRKKIDSIVHYGIGQMDQEAQGQSWLFQDGGPKRHRQWMHRVELKDLKYDTSYEYSVGSNYSWSERLGFKTPPAGEDWVVRAAIYGDLGLENAQSLPYLQDDTERGLYDFIIHVGDFAYDLDTQDASFGDQFMRKIQPIAAHRPYMTCPGNHEAAYNFSNYKNRFSMPGAQQHDNLYYSWNAGSVHFISFSTEFYYRNGKWLCGTGKDDWWQELTRQFYWIKADLTEAVKNREKRPWIIMYGHRPMYCSSKEDECPLPDVPQRQGTGLPEPGYGLEPLLKDFGVDLVIWGHQHAYERTLPLYDHKIYNGTDGNPYVNPLAPVHLVVGSAGCSEGNYALDKKKPWTVVYSSEYGYARLKAHNKTHLYLEQVSVDQKGRVIDSFWLVRENHTAYDIQ